MYVDWKRKEMWLKGSCNGPGEGYGVLNGFMGKALSSGGGCPSGLTRGAQEADEPVSFVHATGLAQWTHPGHLLFLASSFLHFCTQVFSQTCKPFHGGLPGSS